jgi:hypothetical protein
MRFRSILPAVVLLGLACGGADRAGVKNTLAAVETVEDVSMVPVLMVTGFAESGVGGSACSEGLLGYTKSPDPAQAAMMAASAIERCGSCLSDDDLEALAALPDADRTAAAVQRCDAIGPDPVFGGDLAPERSKMRLGDYLLTRMAIEKIWADLGKDSEEGQAITALLPRVAAGLVAANAPEAPATPAPSGD